MAARRIGLVSTLAGIAVLVSTPGASAAPAVPRPVAGHYKIEKQFSYATGSVVINKKRTAVTHVSFTSVSTDYCAPTKIKVVGTFHLHNVADAKGGSTDNMPDDAQLVSGRGGYSNLWR